APNASSAATPFAAATVRGSLALTKSVLLAKAPPRDSPGQVDHPKIGPQRLPALRKTFLRLLVAEAGRDDDGLAGLPVDRRRDLLAVGQLQAVDGAQDLREVAARARRIGQAQPDLLVRVDDVDRAHRHGGIGFGMDHAVEA